MPKRVVIVEPGRIDFEDFPSPELGAGQVRTETLYSGISAGTEMAYYRGTGPELAGKWDGQAGVYDPDAEPTLSYPLSYGYENVGRVMEVAPDVEGLAPGDVVFSYAGHETEVAQDAAGVTKLSDDVSPRAANVLAILRLCYNGVLGAGLNLGETVGVFGLGTLGQCLVQLCKLSGVRVIGIDLIEARRQLAKQLGADQVVDPTAVNLPVWVRNETGGRGLDCAFEVTASEKGLESAVQCVPKQGKVVAMSFYQGTAPLRLGPAFHYNCVRIQVVQDMQIPAELTTRWNGDRVSDETARLLPQLQLEPLITHEFPLADAAEAYRLVDQSPQATLQVVLRHPAAEENA